APRDVEVPGQPGHPAEHLHRLDVQVRTLPTPRVDEIVELVPHSRALVLEPHPPSISLDVKMLEMITIPRCRDSRYRDRRRLACGTRRSTCGSVTSGHGRSST